MTLPNLFLLGAPKCGTTWISSVLRESPEVFITKSKEIHFFDHPEKFERGAQWYQEFFRDSGTAKWVCDGTPNYLATTLRPEHRQMAEHLKELCPDAHFIISFRNPVDRALSSILHQMRKGTLSPFVDCGRYVDGLLDNSIDDRKHGILEFGNYAEQLAGYFSLFSKDKFHFLIFEENIARNRENTVIELCRFLAVNPSPCLRSMDQKANASLRTRGALFVAQRSPRQIALPLARRVEKIVTFPRVDLTLKTREKLWEYYQPMVPRLEELLGRNLDIWKSDPAYGRDLSAA